ncbi:MULTISPECIES: PilZ domain-containing protein [Aeromonas]|uniref:PilZ domain-containing protein n=1 Tax=Aeromonas TaxID=642 RepID=UPI000DD70B37|nr:MULTISPECIES: PilZ domain-containing protein [Aeromonas]AXA99766.1 PilZ domain-containing protein [Aeromonas caviae]QLL81697.1 PilZ domain-containing protein [Aeromonas caviae]QXB99223.1 PilZ domain-containing protein [Aeromonas sp. FDAARGOS 1418]UBS64514.1 PilZ domain-containing protein [Aeromonas caviae]WKS84017.1 PilZ domain-containing protein [Aeromonas caviae]
MDKHQLLTDEELAMLRDLGNDEDIATSQYLRGTLPLPLQSLLQRAKPLTLEARIAGYQLRFPLHCTQAEEGHTELRIAAPTITELGSPHLRAWRLDEKAVLCTEDAEYEVYSLSLGGLIVADLPDAFAKGDPLGGYLRIEDLPPLAMTGTLIRHVDANQHHHDWAVQFRLGKEDQEQLRDWLFQRHQDAFVQAYQGD